jgi:hypothetical protein
MVETDQFPRCIQLLSCADRKTSIYLHSAILLDNETGFRMHMTGNCFFLPRFEKRLGVSLERMSRKNYAVLALNRVILCRIILILQDVEKCLACGQQIVGHVVARSWEIMVDRQRRRRHEPRN